MNNTHALTYHLDFNNFNQHLVDVTLTFQAHEDTPLLWLPSWIPGSYLVREFSRNITAVHYQIKDSQIKDSQTKDTVSNGTNKPNNKNDNSAVKNSRLKDSKVSDNHVTSSDADCETEILRAPKQSKNEWLLDEVIQGDIVEVTYEVYCYDLSVRTAYVDQTRLYGNFTSLALAVSGQEDTPIKVRLSVPASFYDKVTDGLNAIDTMKTIGNKSDDMHVKLACGLPYTHMATDSTHQYSMSVASYHDLIDHPFELSRQTEFDFIIHDSEHNALAHRFFISGKHSTNIGRLQSDLTHICQTYLNWLGDAPFADYTFMTYASGNDYGGLEHINSTSLITPRGDLPLAKEEDEPSKDYQRFLGLCSHEYFHSWWVKTVRPDVMIDVDLNREAYTPLLWVFEGFTSYIDDFMLQASGVTSQQSYLTLLEAQINRYIYTQGRHLQSVAESSFDAWIKLYRADENTGNAGISYYNKGALVALCLDLLLMDNSAGKYRIFDVVKAFYELAKQNGQDTGVNRIGMTAENLNKVMAQFIDIAVWDDFVTRYVEGTDELPIFDLLTAQGINIADADKDNTLPWSIQVTETDLGLRIDRVRRDSVANEAGLSAKDVIVAIDGIKATKKQLQIVAESDLKQVICHAFRRDELMMFRVPDQTLSGIESNPSLEKVVLTLKESGFEEWLSPSFVNK